MLRQFDVHPSLATSDAARAKAWFAEKVGWQPARESSGLLSYDLGRSGFTVYESEYAGTAKSTVAFWLVRDVTPVMTDLRRRGVAFEDYDFGDFKTVDGVMTDPEGRHTAWFKDADGNILSLGDDPDAPSEGTIGAMIATSDLGRAKRWYVETLGFEPRHEFGEEAVGLESGGVPFTVYRSDFAGTAENTVAVWRVSDLRAEVAELRARGVTFEDYDFGEARTVDGVLTDDDGTLLAWFKDPDGNVLGLVEDAAARA